MNYCNELDKIQFGIYSSEEIITNSVCHVTSMKLCGENSVYDPRMGVLESNELCVTCKKDSKYCVGHFGHVELQISVLHPLYNRLILNLLKCVCYKCSRLLMTEDILNINNLLKLSKSSRFNNIVKSMDKIDVCPYCNTFQPKYIFSTSEKQIYMIFKIEGEIQRMPMFENEIYNIFRNMKNEDIVLLGLGTEHFHPKNLIIQTLPVLPPVARPYVMADTVTCDDDLTLQYMEIVKANNHLKNVNTTEFKRQKYIQLIKFRIRSLFDNSTEKQKVNNGRPLKGIKKRLTGKEGIIRNNLMGKRVDRSARSVIGPDPTLAIDEIGIPYEISTILCFPVIVNNINKFELGNLIQENKVNYVIRNNMRINMKYATKNTGTKLQFGDVIKKSDGTIEVIIKDKNSYLFSENDIIYRNGKIIENLIQHTDKKFDLEIGDIVERHLKNNDILLLNRQPTLHRGSMIAQKVRIIPGKTIRLNLAITTSFNADFDGDEMNLFCCNNVEAEAELRMLSNVDNFILNPQSSKANIVIVQDTVLGIYKMTNENMTFPKRLFFKFATAISENINEKIKKKRQFCKQYNGKFLFSLLLPCDFFLVIENRVSEKEPKILIEHGILKEGIVTKKDLNKIISLLYTEYDIDISKNFINQVQYLAMSYLEYCSFTVGIKDCILENDTIQYSIEKSLMKAKSVHETIQNEKIREIYTCHSLGGARDVGLSIAKNSLLPTNNFLWTVKSGAKGDFFNIAQITGLLGQQNVCGGRIPYSLSNNKRSLPHYPINRTHYNDKMLLASRGFIMGCFAKGLTAREFFLHSITGREGITDTAMKTATSGYIQRRMIKVAEDIHIAEDGTVRSFANNIIQFSYGNNYLNPSNSIVKEEKTLPFDISRLMKRMNYNYEQSNKK